MDTKSIRNLITIIFCALFSIISGRDAFAQSASKEGVAIKSLEITKTKPPDFSYGGIVPEANIISADWAKLLVRFDTDADWTDQLEMRFYIVVKNSKTATFTMFTGKYVYSDISKGYNHLVAVYLRPRTMERYGNMVEQVAVEIYYKGEVVSVKSFPASNNPWWRTANVRSVEGYVLDRSQTPFANIASYNYELPRGK